MAKKSEHSIKLQIETDLNEQLEEKGATQEYYKDLVRDYISLYETKNLLRKDIKNRGVAIPWISREGQKGHKKNDNIAELVKVNNQMLKIIADLGLKLSELKAVDNDDEL